jgi:uncharacterized membrane protein
VVASRVWARVPGRARAPGVLVDRGGTRLVLPVRMHSWASRLDLVWAAVWVVAELVLLGALLRSAREAGGAAGATPPFGWLLGFVLLMSAAGAFLLWRVQWLLLGRELVDLLPGRLRLQRRALWKHRPEEIALERIRDVQPGRLHEEPVYPSWGRRFVGKHGGCVVLHLADGGRRVVGRGLGDEDALRVAEAIRRHLASEAPSRAA